MSLSFENKLNKNLSSFCSFLNFSTGPSGRGQCAQMFPYSGPPMDEIVCRTSCCLADQSLTPFVTADAERVILCRPTSRLNSSTCIKISTSSRHRCRTLRGCRNPIRQRRAVPDLQQFVFSSGTSRLMRCRKTLRTLYRSRSTRGPNCLRTSANNNYGKAVRLAKRSADSDVSGRPIWRLELCFL